MKIAQVSPLLESVPPSGYGGTERVVSYLTEELVRQGHEVTLYATGDSQTRAELVAICPRALRLSDDGDPRALHVVMLGRVAHRARTFDLIHYHLDYMHFPLSRQLGVPHLTTMHGRLDLPEQQRVFDEFRDIPLIAISQAQRAALPQGRFCATIHHGLPLDLYAFQPTPGDYLAFVGRISPEKRVDRAIEIARRTGFPLKIAAKIDPVDRAYFERTIAPLLGAPQVEFVGEIADGDKGTFLGGARCLLFPIDWPEPFGLVMIEAMACGTPVVAFRHGSVPEIVDDGVTGFVVDDLEQAVAATHRAARLDRGRCRAAFERRFGVERMVHEYVATYARLADGRGPAARELAA